MKKILFAVVLVISVLASYGESPQPLHVEGKNIVKADGEKFFIRGTNLGNWLNPEGYMFGFHRATSPHMINDVFSQILGPDGAADFWKGFKENYITAEDVNFIASTGANTIRLPFHYKLFTYEDYMGMNDPAEGFRMIDKVVDWCRDAGLYLILDMHDAPGGQTGDNIDDSYGYPWMMTNKKSQDKFCYIWHQIAERYKDEPVILGYELINEPVATYFGEEEKELNRNLVEVLRKGLASIREADKNHIVLIGSPQWNSNFAPLEGVDFNDGNIIYTCHRYGGDATAEAIKSYIDFRDASGFPMYMGEIGHNTNEWQDAFSKVMTANNIGYTFWPYKKCNDSCMNAFLLPEGWEKIAAFADGPRGSYGEVRDNVPDRKEAATALNGLLENIRFTNCKPQTDYIRSMNLK